jgi:hypothetical protein
MNIIFELFTTSFKKYIRRIIPLAIIMEGCMKFLQRRYAGNRE